MCLQALAEQGAAGSVRRRTRLSAGVIPGDPVGLEEMGHADPKLEGRTESLYYRVW